MDKLLVRVATAGELADVSRSTAYALVAAGEWPAIRVRGELRVAVDDLRAWIEEQKRYQSSQQGQADSLPPTAA